MVLNKRVFQLECSSEDVPNTNVTNLEEKDGFMAASLMMLLLTQVAAMILRKVSQIRSLKCRVNDSLSYYSGLSFR